MRLTVLAAIPLAPAAAGAQGLDRDHLLTGTPAQGTVRVSGGATGTS